MMGLPNPAPEASGAPADPEGSPAGDDGRGEGSAAAPLPPRRLTSHSRLSFLKNSSFSNLLRWSGTTRGMVRGRRRGQLASRPAGDQQTRPAAGYPARPGQAGWRPDR